MSRERTVVVLGAYGTIGRELVRVLVEKTEADVIAGGRRQERLDALTRELGPGRVRPRVLDAHDLPSVAAAAAEACLLINCVGPFLDGGADVAQAAIEANASYMDLASEQGHYERLKGLAPTARERNRLLFTGAGIFPGLSGVLAAQGASLLPAVDSVEILFAQGRASDAETGIGSFMTGILEASHDSVSLREGRRTPLRFGQVRRRVMLPEPFGEVQMFELPTLETLTLSEALGAQSVSTWAYVGDIPGALFTGVRLLKPDRRAWAYRFLRRVIRANMKREFERALSRGISAEAWMRTSVRGGDGRWQATLRLPEGGAVPTAYLPAVAARRFLEGRLDRSGLITATDAFPADSLFREIHELGWKLDLRTETRSES